MFCAVETQYEGVLLVFTFHEGNIVVLHRDAKYCVLGFEGTTERFQGDPFYHIVSMVVSLARSNM